MPVQPAECVVAEPEPDRTGCGLLRLPTCSGVRVRRALIERLSELLAGAEEQCARPLLR